MILQKLCDYYDRLAADPNVQISQPGFAPQQVVFEVVIERDGSFHAIQDIRVENGQKCAPQYLDLPDCGKRTSAISAQFLWDKAEYLLGWCPPATASGPKDDPDARAKRELKKRRNRDCFEACRKLHHDSLESVDCVHLRSVCSFLSNWDPNRIQTTQSELLESIGNGFGVFRIRGEKSFVHESPALVEYWQQHLRSSDDLGPSGLCLVTGQELPIARLHPTIKGFRDQQNIVAFNKGKNAFESYGNHDAQGLNAPTGVGTAFKYTTAMNRMLSKSSPNRLSVGETSVVFWADQPTPSEDIFGFAVDSSVVSEDEDRASEIRNTLKRVACGQADPPDEGEGFYVLGLSDQVKARLSVRFWIESSVGEVIRRVAEHQQRLEIDRGEKDRDVIPLWLILAQTARETKEIPPLLGGALMRAVLTGGRYPDALLSAIVRRIRADREIKHVRAATIKAILNHNHQLEIPIMLDMERKNTSYQLGRLFASLERAQEDALPGLNATIKDHYFGAASATPATVFPRLIRMSQHHVGKLEGGRKVVADKRLQEIIGHIDSLPTHLDLTDQGLFFVGYYHQRQAIFTKKDQTNETDD